LSHSFTREGKMHINGIVHDGGNDMQIKWVRHNRKLAKLATIGFGIPAFRSLDGFKTCPMAGPCSGPCYARQGTYNWPATVKAREHNLALVRGDLAEFVKQAILDLSSSRAETVRIHDSGDFFSQEYLGAWIEIAVKTPSKIFYAYSKSLHLDWSKLPSNFRITFSQGGLMDDAIDKSKPHSRIFSTVEAREHAGYVDGNVSDLPAIEGDIKIGLVYHGVKKMTPAQTAYFG
jgi:hypothetical protein